MESANKIHVPLQRIIIRRMAQVMALYYDLELPDELVAKRYQDVLTLVMAKTQQLTLEGKILETTLADKLSMAWTKSLLKRRRYKFEGILKGGISKWEQDLESCNKAQGSLEFGLINYLPMGNEQDENQWRALQEQIKEQRLQTTNRAGTFVPKGTDEPDEEMKEEEPEPEHVQSKEKKRTLHVLNLGTQEHKLHAQVQVGQPIYLPWSEQKDKAKRDVEEQLASFVGNTIYWVNNVMYKSIMDMQYRQQKRIKDPMNTLAQQRGQDVEMTQGTTGVLSQELVAYIIKRLNTLQAHTQEPWKQQGDIMQQPILLLRTRQEEGPDHKTEKSKLDKLAEIAELYEQKTGKDPSQIITTGQVIEFIQRTYPEKKVAALFTPRDQKIFQDENENNLTVREIIEQFVYEKISQWDERIKGPNKREASEAYVEYLVMERTIQWETEQDILSLNTDDDAQD